MMFVACTAQQNVLVSIIKLTISDLVQFIVNFNPFLISLGESMPLQGRHGVTVMLQGNLGHRLLDAANIAHCLSHSLDLVPPPTAMTLSGKPAAASAAGLSIPYPTLQRPL